MLITLWITLWWNYYEPVCPGNEIQIGNLFIIRYFDEIIDNCVRAYCIYFNSPTELINASLTSNSIISHIHLPLKYRFTRHLIIKGNHCLRISCAALWYFYKRRHINRCFHLHRYHHTLNSYNTSRLQFWYFVKKTFYDQTTLHLGVRMIQLPSRL